MILARLAFRTFTCTFDWPFTEAGSAHSCFLISPHRMDVPQLLVYDTLAPLDAGELQSQCCKVGGSTDQSSSRFPSPSLRWQAMNHHLLLRETVRAARCYRRCIRCQSMTSGRRSTALNTMRYWQELRQADKHLEDIERLMRHPNQA
jgi:hypothetical protein